MDSEKQSGELESGAEAATGKSAGERAKAQGTGAEARGSNAGEEVGAAQEKFSIDDDFEKSVQNWLASTKPEERIVDGGYFKVGKTSDVLTSIGVRNGAIYWRKYKIGIILQEHSEMGEDTIKQLHSIPCRFH